MPRNCLQLYQVHIADGFSNDCDELVNKCLQVENFDFKEFCKIWKEMNFDLLYQGRTSGAELAELSEELLHIAKHYMVKDTSYFTESVTGLFLVYSLLSLQPFAGFAYLRIIPDDVRAINRIEVVARRDRRPDVLYILGEVLTKWSQFHADERVRGMESVVRKYLEGYTSIDKLGVRPMGIFYRQNEELDHIRDLGVMTRQYALAKKALFGENPGDQSLQYTNENIANELSTSFRKLISGDIEDTDDEDEDGEYFTSDEERREAEERSNTLKNIKYRAMANAVDPMKHLTCAYERKQAKTNPKHRSDLKRPTGKIKTGTHTKLITTSPKKRKQTSKNKKKKTKPISDENASGDDAEINLAEFNKVSADISSADVTIEEIESEKDNATEEGTNEQTKQKKPEGIVEIDVESLPLIMRTGDWGSEIEVEVIGYAKPGNPKPNANETKKKGKSTETPSSSKAKDDTKQQSPKVKESFKTYKKINKDRQPDSTKTSLVKKRDKSEQKRRDLKSRLKRLGVLPIANFKDQNKNKK